MMDDKEQREYFERQRLEQERRDDVLEERAFWANAFFSVFDDTPVVSTAADKADAALAMYRQRFQ